MIMRFIPILVKRCACYGNRGHFVNYSDFYPIVHGDTMYLLNTPECRKGCVFRSSVERVTQNIIKVYYSCNGSIVGIRNSKTGEYMKAWYNSGHWWFERKTGRRTTAQNSEVLAMKVLDTLMSEKSVK